MENQKIPILILFFLTNVILSLLDQGTLISYIIFIQLPFILILFYDKNNLRLPLFKPILIINIIFIINFIFSSNKQYTFEKMLIWLSVYLIFNLIYNFYLSNQFKKKFLNSLIYSSLLIIPFFLYFRFTHKVFNVTALSLIQPATGHVHIASLFLMALTASFLTQKLLLSIIFFLALIATCSISAFTALFIGSLVLNLLPNKLISQRKKRALLFASLFVLLIFTFLSYKTPKILRIVDPLWTKKSLGGSRLIYWSQAVKGFLARPITGWGLDTFGIISHKFKNYNFDYSLYPHGFIFKIAAETGVIGLLAFLYLIFRIIKNLSLKPKINKIILAVIAVSFFESLFDYSWQFLSILLIIAISLAMIIKPSPKYKQVNFPRVVLFCLALSFFSTSLIFSTFLKRQGKYKLAWFFYPLDSEIYIENYQFFPSQLSNYLYGQDPDFWDKLGNHYEKSGEIGKQIKAREKEIDSLSPATAPLKTLTLIDLYLKNNNYQKAVDLIFDKVWLDFHTKDKINNFTQEEKTLINKTRRSFPNLYKNQVINMATTINIRQKPQRFYTLLLYHLGLKIYQQNQREVTEIMWKKITEINPEWSYFHIELANLYWAQGEKDKATNQLKNVCKQYSNPKNNCLNYLNNYPQFQPPGSLIDKVKQI